MIQSFKGKSPRIPKSTYVSEMATIIGDVEIGENCGVWPGAVIRGDFSSISIGNNTFIEDNCVLHGGVHMEIGDNVIIGHGVVMHGRKISSNTLIGNNATILDAAEIGSFCIIAAGSLVKTAAQIPDESLVSGVPGLVKSKISARQLAMITDGIKDYTWLARQYWEQSQKAPG